MGESSFYVLIATTDRKHLLARTLKSLSACDRPPGYQKTIVVENGRKTGTEEVVKQFEAQLSAQYLCIEEANKSAALNHALGTLEEGLIFFTDDDVRVDPGTLMAYAGATRPRDGGCFYGGPTGVDYEEAPPAWLREYLPPSAKGLSYTEEELRGDRFCWFLGFNWAAFVNDLKRVGWFNCSFGPGSPSGRRGQETEMQNRLRDSGVEQLYVPQARVWHYVPKQRCSPIWALRRVYRYGIARGIALASEPSSGQRELLGLGYKWSRKAAKSAVRTVKGDKRERFAAYYELAWQTGILTGFRRAR